MKPWTLLLAGMVAFWNNHLVSMDDHCQNHHALKCHLQVSNAQRPAHLCQGFGYLFNRDPQTFTYCKDAGYAQCQCHCQSLLISVARWFHVCEFHPQLNVSRVTLQSKSSGKLGNENRLFSGTQSRVSATSNKTAMQPNPWRRTYLIASNFFSYEAFQMSRYMAQANSSRWTRLSDPSPISGSMIAFMVCVNLVTVAGISLKLYGRSVPKDSNNRVKSKLMCPSGIQTSK